MTSHTRQVNAVVTNYTACRSQYAVYMCSCTALFPQCHDTNQCHSTNYVWNITKKHKSMWSCFAGVRKVWNAAPLYFSSSAQLQSHLRYVVGRYLAIRTKHLALTRMLSLQSVNCLALTIYGLCLKPLPVYYTVHYIQIQSVYSL